MESSIETENCDDKRPAEMSPAKRILGWLSLLVYISLFFVCAGRADWWQGWAFLAVMVSGMFVHARYLAKHNPELRVWRQRIGGNTKKWDRIWLLFFGILYLSILVVGALDSGRFLWSSMPAGWFALGAALFAVSFAFVTWAMAVNPHFEKTVRIQHDREHQVIESGPYRIVRHPGYLGTLFGFMAAAPFMLGSWWAHLPAGLTGIWMIIRTGLEDKTLQAELPGYSQYAKRVPYRLVPHVW